MYSQEYSQGLQGRDTVYAYDMEPYSWKHVIGLNKEELQS